MKSQDNIINYIILFKVMKNYSLCELMEVADVTYENNVLEGTSTPANLLVSLIQSSSVSGAMHHQAQR